MKGNDSADSAVIVEAQNGIRENNYKKANKATIMKTKLILYVGSPAGLRVYLARSVEMLMALGLAVSTRPAVKLHIACKCD